MGLALVTLEDRVRVVTYCSHPKFEITWLGFAFSSNWEDAAGHMKMKHSLAEIRRDQNPYM